METKLSKKLSDDELIAFYLETQRGEYFSLLYERYIHKIYNKSYSLLRNSLLAEDATQEIYVKIFMNLSKFNGQSRFSTWVYSITYNFCIDLIRKQKKDAFILSNDDGKEYGNIVEDDIEDKELLEMEIDRLQVILNKLPVDDKAVLLMKYQEDMSIKEIGEIISKTESAVKMKIKRAKQKARKVYEEIFE